jgi:hypothetical protein
VVGGQLGNDPATGGPNKACSSPKTRRAQLVDATLACSLPAGVFSKFEFPAHASGADETLVSFGLRSNRWRHNVARCGGITLYQVAELIVISNESTPISNVSSASGCNSPCRGVPQAGHASAFKVISAPQHPQKRPRPVSTALRLSDDAGSPKIRDEAVGIQFGPLFSVTIWI